MKQITQKTYNETLALHEKWLRDEPDGVRMVFADLDLSEIDFGIRANLCGANLTRADLTGANLTAADLTSANLTRADLTRANLTGANLTAADLTSANLDGANLTGANLTGADLDGANLTSANLCGANGEKLTFISNRPFLSIGPIGSRSDYLQAFITDAGIVLSTGCFRYGTIAKFREELAKTHGDNVHAQEYEAALVLIEAHARLWTPKGEE
jgi:hypothetical protein